MLYVYKIENLISHKVYIGKTNNLKARWSKHMTHVHNKTNRHLYDAINKYGESCFSIVVIEECCPLLINDRERYWISYFNSTDRRFGYNYTLGGDGGYTLNNHPRRIEIYKQQALSRTGRKQTQETKDKLSKAMKLRGGPTEAQCKSSSETLKRKYASGEIKLSGVVLEKRSGEKHPMYGKTHTDEVRHRISASTSRTWNERFKSEGKADTLRLKMSARFSGANNCNYKKVDMQIVIQLLIEQHSTAYIANYVGMTIGGLHDKFKKHFGITTCAYCKMHGIKQIKGF